MDLAINYLKLVASQKRVDFPPPVPVQDGGGSPVSTNGEEPHPIYQPPIPTVLSEEEALIQVQEDESDSPSASVPHEAEGSLASTYGEESDHQPLSTDGEELDLQPPSATVLHEAGAIFTSLSSCDSAFAVQQIAEIAEGDNRGLALLLPIIPAILWVLYNILQPALNQLNRMRSDKSVIVGLGLGGLAASSFMVNAPSASASELATIADATSNDSRGLLLLFVITPAVLWVLYNILQPALNQINRMRSG
ncbi:hypothetical protein MRB53_034982 [Persea americana]|uniref:Uncharacterized protein n=1 Tax=Persea americana TaxID=3435 RepID=A0ACC2K3E9_PERAE|nr:hypothetical protein MRB53_034982 [Persea americana]